MVNKDSKFALWLRVRMAEMSISVTELADMCGVNIATVSHWRTGRRDPSERQRRLLAVNLGTTEAVIKRKLQRIEA